MARRSGSEMLREWWPRLVDVIGRTGWSERAAGRYLGLRDTTVDNWTQRGKNADPDSVDELDQDCMDFVAQCQKARHEWALGQVEKIEGDADAPLRLRLLERRMAEEYAPPDKAGHDKAAQETKRIVIDWGESGLPEPLPDTDE